MINRYYLSGEKLDVAGLNQMIVLLDRSESEQTEVALNEWRAGLNGPPHQHDEKEQIFYITSGRGYVQVGPEKFQVSAGDMIHIPVSVVHRTVVTGDLPLHYILFNVFITKDKEGHHSFAEHIEKVKDIRRKQAESGKAEVEGAEQTKSSAGAGKFISNVLPGQSGRVAGNQTIRLLDKKETAGCSCAAVILMPGNKSAAVTQEDKELTFFILSGEGTVQIGGETEPIKAGHLIFVPRNVSYTLETSETALAYLCLESRVRGKA
jgi:mannose-6-phosphate isomerase-like protein (cupin superfamily)